MKGKEIVMPAGILRRASAFIIDILVIDLVLAMPFNSLIERAAPKNPFDLLSSNSPALTGIGIVLSLIALAYFAILEYKLGQTVGKILMDIYVEEVGRDRSIWKYLARSIFIIPVIPFVFFWIADPLYMIFSKDQRRLLEVFSGTRTVMKVMI